MASEYSLKAMRYDRVKVAEGIQELYRIFAYPKPGAHFQREWKEYPGPLSSVLVIQGVPQVTMGAVGR